MKSKRPVNLSVSQILKVNSSPIAIASILHRISGIILFLLIPVLLYVLQVSLGSAEGFATIFDNLVLRFLVWVFVAATGYHFVMGIKHLMGDMGVNEEFESGKRASLVSLVIAAIVIIASFVWVML